ncbi:enoyl-CoA hydratase/isomerase family protein [Aurantiacibacter marinus]|uniref:Enoyl-CoA hydratase n=1 Tax=Aurantiacibacter marinus TaxID=874156 RepID=A0A0H0XKK0_9SPHN|nr:enoyl-CoA hydratase/isomerase family protein [Aurantiacibacter marinus]KLI62849.1 enoyl-CoA hydratase [Aurantiacibacter marinus]
MNLRLEFDGPVAHLLIDRLDKRNAFNMAMWEAMPGLLEQARADPAVRTLVIRSAQPGGVFCAGADIKEMLLHKDDGAWLAANQAAINRVQHDLARLTLPTVAFVEGDCVGGGCGIAIACDLRVATDKARFGITPGKLGIVYPLHDVKLLTDLVGPGQAKRMLFTGGLLDAAEAQRIGLVEMIADSPRGLLNDILSASPHSIREIKMFVRRVLDGQTGDDDQTLAIFTDAFMRGDFAEGAAAFAGKRKPDFNG